jgi:hypothetical protein
MCVVDACEPGFADCNGADADGCEADVSSDAANCGACGNVCMTPHATPACESGECVIASCNPSFGDCDGMVANGCETDITSDPSHCGGCGLVCDGTCELGVCHAECPAGTADCDGNPDNGCETDTTSDEENCGGCNINCSPISVCENSVCFP